MTFTDQVQYHAKYGAMVYETTDASWAVIRAAAGDNHVSATSSGVIWVAKNTSGWFASLYRYIFVFSTSDLPDGAVITGATVGSRVIVSKMILVMPMLMLICIMLI